MHDIRTDAPPPRSAIVVGAGIGGLTAAAALRRLGLEVAVLERGAELRPAGTGLMLWPNALRALEEIGLRAAVEAVGRPIAASAVLDADGTVLSESPLDAVTRAVGPVLALHRADLHAVLLEAAGRDRVTTGAAVAAVIDEEERAGVRLESGEERFADVVVAADGIGSRLRPAVTGVSAEPVYAGARCWRGVAELELDAPRATETWGVARRFGLVPLSGGRCYWFATETRPPAAARFGADGARSGAGASPEHDARSGAGASPEHDARSGAGPAAEHDGEAVHARLLAQFGDWHAPIGDVLRATDPAQVVASDLEELPRLATWSHQRIALLGDAAHAMTPNLGQGAAMAIEDAVVLGRELGRGRRDVETALDAYAALRRPRVQRIARDSRWVGRIAQARSPLAVRARTWATRATPAAVTQRRLLALVAFE